MILKYVYIYYHGIYVLCVFFYSFKFYLYNTAFSVLFCVNKDIIINIIIFV